ncbi:MAG TPA: LamG domain-containing protein [Verrucomicrobiae bacterium]
MFSPKFSKRLVFLVLLAAIFPGVPRSAPAATGPEVAVSPAVAVRLETNPNRHYVIQSTTTLENPTWYDITGVISGDGTVQSFFQRIEGVNSGFFRAVEHDIDAGMVAHYRLDGNANDATEYENDGIVLGAIPTKDRFGNLYGAYHFNGIDQYILIPHSQQQMLAAGDFTVAYWVNFEVQQPSVHLFGKSDGPGNMGKWIIRHDMSAGFLLNLNSSSGSAAANAAGAWMFASNVWMHVAHTRTGEDYKTYINGRLVSDVRYAVPSSTSFSSFTIGQVENANWFQGTLDDIRIYNRALSATEVKALHNYNPVKLGQNLVAQYSFNGDPALESIYGQNATANGVSLVPDRLGRPNRAAFFDGVVSRLELPRATLADEINLEFTISMWLQFQGTAGEKHFFGRSNGGGNQLKWIWLYRSNPGELSFLVNNNPTVETLAARTSWAYSTNSWYHFVLTKQGSTYVTYINGLKSAQTNGPSVLSYINSPLRLGNVEGANGFQGKVDDLRIYNRALSENEVQELGEMID